MVVVGIATAASTDAKASKSERGRVRRMSFIVFMFMCRLSFLCFLNLNWLMPLSVIRKLVQYFFLMAAISFSYGLLSICLGRKLPLGVLVRILSRKNKFSVLACQLG